LREDHKLVNLDLFVDEEKWQPVSPDSPFGPELEWWRKGWTVIGVDEAGRGPLAGPVVAAAVAFQPDVTLEGIGDSKQLSARIREKLETKIKKLSISHAVIEVDHNQIDKINILQATKVAMSNAVSNVLAGLNSFDHSERKEQHVILIDGRIPFLGLGQQVNIIKGDRRSFSIGAASILAKVHRDRLMIELDDKFPGYGFAQHKGYGTRMHVQAIRDLGYCTIHRRSFRIRALDNELK